MVNDTGMLTIGTADDPVEAGVNSEIVICDSRFIDRVDYTNTEPGPSVVAYCCSRARRLGSPHEITSPSR